MKKLTSLFLSLVFFPCLLSADNTPTTPGETGDKSFVKEGLGFDRPRRYRRIDRGGFGQTPPPSPPAWVGIIGIDYQPNHYPAGHVFNEHDVFFVGTNSSGDAVSNIYAELQQLKAAGFTHVRSYQTEPYAWIDLINQANALGLSVIYEAVIPQNGSTANITNATDTLTDVVNEVGISVFSDTVVLVLAGHENYSSSDVTYLTTAISQLQSTLSTLGVSSIPVGTALVSGDLVTPSSTTDMQTLITASSAEAPLGFDPYPFQWGVTPADEAASSAALTNSIAWDYAKVEAQSFYTSGKPILMAETGWATQGTGEWAGYYCYGNTTNPCEPSVSNTASYLQAVYSFVKNQSNNASVLVFEAYDEPAKSPTHPDNAENYYGLFDSDCTLKSSNTNLLPNTAFVTGTTQGCQGFTSGTTFTVSGTQNGNATNQPPFTVMITQTNPVTSADASFSATIPNADRTDTSVNPWPRFLLFDGATVEIAGVTSGASCSFTATLSSGVITWSTPSCTDSQQYPVSCTGSTCYLPWNNF